MTATHPVLNIVVPCFNEEEALDLTIPCLLNLLDGLTTSVGSAMLTLIDDGSKDRTWDLINEWHAKDARVHGLKLSRNCGHQRALMAGLLTAKGDVLISMDADLQDDLNVIPRMLEAYAAGAQIVYGVRSRRDNDTTFKRITAEMYYSTLRYFGVEIIPNHADYRLMSRRALEALSQFSEVNLFLRGIIPQLGFKTAKIEYVRQARNAGVSKYPIHKMILLAVDGITSFSAVPLQWITRIGLLISFISLMFGIWAISIKLFYGSTSITGWASTVVPIFFLGGLQLLALGIIGSYVSKIYMETKRRPRFIIEEEI